MPTLTVSPVGVDAGLGAADGPSASSSVCDPHADEDEEAASAPAVRRQCARGSGRSGHLGTLSVGKSSRVEPDEGPGSREHRAVSRGVYIPVPMPQDARDRVFRTADPMRELRVSQVVPIRSRRPSAAVRARRAIGRCSIRCDHVVHAPAHPRPVREAQARPVRDPGRDARPRPRAWRPRATPVLKLNTGNPAAFGFEAPHQIVRDMIAAIPLGARVHRVAGHPVRRAARSVTRYETDPASRSSTSRTSSSATASPS